MKKILKWLDDNIELYICVFLMSFMTLLVFVQVVMRYVFNNSLSWSEELARYTFIWLIYIGISYGCKLRKHIKIDAALTFSLKRRGPMWSCWATSSSSRLQFISPTRVSSTPWSRSGSICAPRR